MPIRADGPVPPPPPPQPAGLPKAAKWRPDEWRCHLYGMHWDGTQELLAQDVPIAGLEVTTTLSGTDTIRGTLSPEIPDLINLVEPGATAIMVEFGGDNILAMCLVDDRAVDGPGLSISSSGFFGYLKDCPYLGVEKYTQVDPMVIVRQMWAHVQDRKHEDLGLIVDKAKSPVRVGTPKTKDHDGNIVDAEPYVLAWYQTDDLSNEFMQLQESTPFDFRELHTWNGPGAGDIHHRLQIEYPRLGRRQHELRFRLGENLASQPSLDQSADDFAGQVMMLGAGEGSDKLRKTVQTPYKPTPGRKWRRPNRTRIVDDSSLDQQSKVNAAARAEAKWRDGSPSTTEIVVWDHENAPFGSWGNGDDIHLTGRDVPWIGELDLWVRVLSTTYKRDEGTAILSVVASERTDRG